MSCKYDEAVRILKGYEAHRAKRLILRELEPGELDLHNAWIDSCTVTINILKEVIRKEVSKLNETK